MAPIEVAEFMSSLAVAPLWAAGELRFACVPSIADERFRDVIRAIEDCRGDLMRGRSPASVASPPVSSRSAAPASSPRSVGRPP